MLDEVLHLLAVRVAQSLYAAEIGRVSLDEVGIELMLADNLAESVANLVRPPFLLAGCGGNFFGSGAEWDGSARDPISSTEQMPIPYALRSARLTARVSATRILLASC